MGLIEPTVAPVVVAVGLAVGLSSTAVRSQDAAVALEAQAQAAEQAGQLQQAFDLYVRAVQALPDPPPLDADIRLRGRLIALAPRLRTPPTMPEDAERFTVRGQALFKDAQDGYGLEEAATELRKAVRAAPWVPQLAFNLALVQEKQEFYRGATANLKLYVSSSPADAQELKAKIYELELRGERSPLARLKEDCNTGSVAACGEVSKAAWDRDSCNSGNVAEACSRVSQYSDRDVALRDINGLYWGCFRPCEAGDLPACSGFIDLIVARQDGDLQPGLDSKIATVRARLSDACDRGSARSCTDLARPVAFDALFGRRGATKELGRAAQLFKRGCDGGDERGCEGLTSIKKGCDLRFKDYCEALRNLNNR